MSDLSITSPFPNNKISTGTIIAIIASVGFHGLLFTFSDIPLFSVEKKEIKSTPIRTIQLNEAEAVRLPDLSPPPLQIPEFPNTPLSNIPLLQTAIKLPFDTIPAPPPPLPDASVFLPSPLPDAIPQINPLEPENLPPVEQLSPDEIVPPPLIPPPLETKLDNSTRTPAIPRKDDLQELKKQLEIQRQLESELDIDIDSIEIRSANDILKEFSAPQISQNPQAEDNNQSDSNTATTPNPVENREFPLLPSDGQQKIVINPEEINSSQSSSDNKPTSEKDLLAIRRQNVLAEIQQRAEALEENKTNTSDKEGNDNYLNWLVTTNQTKPEKLTIKGKYPKDACLKKLEGSSTYGVTVDAQGVATNSQLIKSAGYPIFDRNSRQDISSNKFNNDTGKPLHYLVTVDFAYNQDICPDQIPTNNKKPTSPSSVPPILDEVPESVKKPVQPNTPTEDKKPQPNPVNTPTEDKKPQPNPVNTPTEEKKPQPNPVNIPTEDKKPEESKPLNDPIPELTKPRNDSSSNNNGRPTFTIENKPNPIPELTNP